MELTRVYSKTVKTVISALSSTKKLKTSKTVILSLVYLLEYSGVLVKKCKNTVLLIKHGFVKWHGFVVKDTGIFCSSISRSGSKNGHFGQKHGFVSRIDVCRKQWDGGVTLLQKVNNLWITVVHSRLQELFINYWKCRNPSRSCHQKRSLF